MKKSKALIFSLDRTQKTPLFRQLYEALRENIVTGCLSEGDTLPPTRSLAMETGVSRASVINAYEQLLTEGYISSVRGAGYRVLGIGGLELNRARAPVHKPSQARETGADLPAAPFDAGAMDHRLFPVRQWAKTISRLCRVEPESMMFGEQDRANVLLREAIAHHVFEWRGITCNPSQIIITAGSTDALEICIEALSQAGDIINVEDPGYLPTCQYIVSRNRAINPLCVDEHGARTDNLHPASRLALLTPSHQFPLGVTLSVSRRMAFIDWAQKNDGWIIEDDYDSEFRYAGSPIPALFAFDKTEHTLYIGSFAKLFSSSLRISYLILPPRLRAVFSTVTVRSRASCLPQRMLAEFLANGEFYKYLRRARKVYASRRQCLLNALAQEMQAFGVFQDHKAGTLVVFHLHKSVSDSLVEERARSCGLSLRALSTFCHDSTAYNGLVMGFIAWDELTLKAAVIQLKNILMDMAR